MNRMSAHINSQSDAGDNSLVDVLDKRLFGPSCSETKTYQEPPDRLDVERG